MFTNGRRGMRCLAVPVVGCVLALAVTLTGVPEAAALWSASTAPGSAGQSAARSMTPGQEPSVSTQPSTGNTVVVEWAPSTGSPVEGYEVLAYDAVSEAPRAVGGTCAGLVIGTSCTDSDVPDGQWSYTVTPRRAGWSGSESPRSTPTWVDTVAPVIVREFPDPGGIYNQASWDGGCSSPGACGAGTDVGSGIVSGGVIVQQASTGLYWDGTAFASDVEILLVPTDFGAGGSNVWGFPSSNFPTDGVYTMAAVATDAVGNSTFTSATFTIDRVGPATADGFPADGGIYNVDLWQAGCPTPGFCGTATDVGGQPVVSAFVSVRQGTGLYWDGTAFASPTEVLIPATDPAGFPFPVTNFPTDGFYTVRVELTDAASNVTVESSTFRIDRVAPTLTPIFPEAGGTYNTATWDVGCPAPGICASGADESGPLASELVSIRQNGTGMFWDGTGFSTPFEQLLDVTGVGFLSFPASNFPSDGSYNVRNLVRDQASNVTSVSNTVTIDRAAPTVGLTFPVNGATYATSAWNAGCAAPGVCGTTTDATSGVASSRVSIRQGTGLYWDGTAFASATEVFTSVAADLALPFGISNFPADGSYTTRAESSDFAGNTATASATFTIDRAGPTFNFTFPVNGGFYNTTRWNAGCPTPGFCGTITDAAGTTSGQVSIRQGTGNYWNGTSFASATEVLHPFTTAGGLPFPISQFPTNVAYTVRGVATDPSGNTTSTSATFTIDRVIPTVTALTESNANGLLASGDSVSITFSEAIEVSTICSTWTGTGNQSLSNATITVTDNLANDSISAVTSPTCTLRTGTLVTNNDYVTSNATFNGTVTWTSSTRVLRIIFGATTSGTLNTVVQATDTSSFTPSTLLTDRAGNALAGTTYSQVLRRF